MDMYLKCENGGELFWDDTNKVVLFSGSSIDSCYVYFDSVQKAVINGITTSDITTTSITITINASKGNFDISKYYYSIDDGSSWNESTSNVITISGLTKETEYTIKTYVQDAKGINSEYKSLSVETLGLITFTLGTITFSAETGMTFEEWINSTYNIYPSNNQFAVCWNSSTLFSSYAGCQYNVSNISNVIVHNSSYTCIQTDHSG